MVSGSPRVKFCDIAIVEFLIENGCKYEFKQVDGFDTRVSACNVYYFFTKKKTTPELVSEIGASDIARYLTELRMSRFNMFINF